MPQFDTTYFASEIFWTLVSFALLFVLLKWLVLPRLTAVIDKRTRIIEDELNQARRQREEAEALRADYRKQLDAAAEDAQRLFQESEARVRRQHRRMMDEWKADMKRREAAFREEAEIARLRAIREIRSEAAELVSEAAGKLLQEHLGQHEAERALQEAIHELEHQPPRRH